MRPYMDSFSSGLLVRLCTRLLGWKPPPGEVIFTELVPLKAFSLETWTLFVLEAVQPVGREVLPSKSAQISWPPLQPEPDELLDELELLLELDDELLELEELELEELEEELLELEDELPDLEPSPPQAARAQDARITGISLFM